tara:strand:- start:329 stop:559 length:231 start_codon:yes stop_codon:yes gene_type:complete
MKILILGLTSVYEPKLQKEFELRGHSVDLVYFSNRRLEKAKKASSNQNIFLYLEFINEDKEFNEIKFEDFDDYNKI